MEPSEAQYPIINALQTLELLNYNTSERDRGVCIATPSLLPVAAIAQDGEIYPIEWVQDDDDN